MSTSKSSGVRVLVTGAGGFIGHHLVAFLKEQGYWVRGVDLKRPEYAPTVADEFQLLDLRRRENCLEATSGNRRSLRTGGGHGRNGFHLPPSRADSPQQYSDQYTHTRRSARKRRSSLSVHVVGLCLSRVSAGRYERRATSRGTRVPSCTTRRIWMGEADYGATLRTLPGRLRYGNADRPLPQHIRAVRNLGWRS